MTPTKNPAARLLPLLLAAAVSCSACAKKMQDFSPEAQPLPAGSAAAVAGKDGRVCHEVPVDGRVNGLVFNGGMEIVFRQGSPSAPAVRVYALPEDWNNVKTESSGNNLMLSLESNRGDRVRGEVRVEVELPALAALTLNGSSTFEAATAVEGSRLSMVVNGSGEIRCPGMRFEELQTVVNGSGAVLIDSVRAGNLVQKISGSGGQSTLWVQAEAVEVSVAGSGDVRLEGTSSYARLSLDGSGEVEADRLEAGRVEASLSGSGRISCCPVAKLDATAAGSGSIRYTGTPEECNASGNVQGRGRGFRLW